MENAAISPFSYEIGKHGDKNVIWIRFPYDKELLKIVRSYVGVQWSNTNKAWYVSDNTSFRAKFGLPDPTIGKLALMHIHPINEPAFLSMQDELKLRAYSPSTQHTYLIEFAQLLYILKDFNVVNLTPERIRSYFLYCIKQNKITEIQLNSRINAIKFYFEKVLKRKDFFIDIPRPKSPKQLPKLLNTNEINKIFEVTENKKHRLILYLAYGMGMRVSEIAKLEIADIDSTSMRVHIRGAKGKKDRYVNLPENTLPLLREYYVQYKPKRMLFEGQFEEHYSIRSLQQVFKNAMNKANIKKTVGIHSLRHSYATHLLEYGTDISLIQKLLGHNDIKTTQIYTHVGAKDVAKVLSPLDKLLNKQQTINQPKNA